MFLKRQIPLFIVIAVGLITLFGHFIANDGVQNFVNNDSTQWFDIIASFAIILGGLNLLKLQLQKIFRKQKNWQYSILAVLGFFFAIFAGFFFRGANVVTLENVNTAEIPKVAEIIANETGTVNSVVLAGLEASPEKYDIQRVYITADGAEELGAKLEPYGTVEVAPIPWGAHLQANRGNTGSLFYWMFKNIFTPLSATMFALLAFFVASASYRAFRIRNFEATLLLSAGIILMLGRVPVGQMLSPWVIGAIFIFGVGGLLAPWVRNRLIIFGVVAGGLLILVTAGFMLDWDSTQPAIFYLPVLQEWIFKVPTTAGARAIMIGIGLGIVGTSFRIIIGLERSFLGEN